MFMFHYRVVRKKTPRPKPNAWFYVSDAPCLSNTEVIYCVEVEKNVLSSRPQPRPEDDFDWFLKWKVFCSGKWVCFYTKYITHASWVQSDDCTWEMQTIPKLRSERGNKIPNDTCVLMVLSLGKSLSREQHGKQPASQKTRKCSIKHLLL
jgi:hypothetical protein